MREIKFRAWLLEENRMIDPVIGLDLGKPHQYVQWYEGEDEMISGHCHDCPFERTVLMQYTSLTDRNGKQIYEGDIVVPRYNRFSPMVVSYENGKYNISEYNIKKCEVIGNIYANPELVS